MFNLITQVSQVQELALSKQVNEVIRLVLMFSLIPKYRGKCSLLILVDLSTR